MTTYHLFEGYGIELEYMIVNKDTLAVKSIADELLKNKLGKYGSDYENGMITWSNELVTHVIEIKSTKPESDLVALEDKFQQNIGQINTILSQWNACLMPTAAHPFMNPSTDTKLWPHDNNEVYAVYNTIFDCRGHGWSNLQSTHLNLPFSGDAEFEKLHAAIRIVLPLLPALCASSPVLDGMLTGMHDTRLKYYKNNQAEIPSITGRIIPEQVFSEKEHQDTILKKIEDDIAPYNTENILESIWVNSRGAMSRFDRGSIEIRIMDIQECVKADLAIQALVIELIKAFCEEEFISLAEQKKWSAEDLAAILDQTMVDSQQSIITNSKYLNLFGLNNKTTTQTIWQIVLEKLKNRSALVPWLTTLRFILTMGTLSQRIIESVENEISLPHIYRKLCICLSENKLYS
jgi:gamma-glutamyl:cysteine ligase YbdK (ATP-grasp superfamily)